MASSPVSAADKSDDVEQHAKLLEDNDADGKVLVDAGDSAAQLSRALDQLECDNEKADFIEGIESLLIYVRNLIDYPAESKYRSIRRMNTHFVQRLGHLKGGVACLNAVGFQPEGDFLVLDSSKYAEEQLALLEMQRELKIRLENAEKQFQRQNIRLPIEHTWKTVKAAAAAEARGSRSYMEDDYIMLDQFGDVQMQSFFAVYDGHGGREAVDYVVRALHHNFAKALRESPEESPSKCFEEAYLVTDSQIRRRGILQAGTTACTVLIREEATGLVLHSANVGDSRIVLSRRDGSVLRLSCDHKPSLESEKTRIKEAGGFVGRFNRVNGVLAISRALGDHMMKPSVSAVPYTSSTRVEDGDIVILACDGIWDVFSDEEAIQVIRDHLNGKEFHRWDSKQLEHAAKTLVKAALDRGSLDNVTVLIVIP